MSRLASVLVFAMLIPGVTACAVDHGAEPSLGSSEQGALLADDEAPHNVADLGENAAAQPQWLSCSPGQDFGSNTCYSQSDIDGIAQLHCIQNFGPHATATNKAYYGFCVLPIHARKGIAYNCCIQ
jgi:hypothetical protein